MQDYEIILVDSGSTDGTLEIAREHGIDDIVYIDPAEFSFGRALNYGCEAASGEFCVIASAHVYPTRDDWLAVLLETFEDNIALVYGKQRGNEVTSFSENQIFKQWFPEHDIDRQEHPFCNNANAAIRRELWEEHPYDESLTGLEDVAWAKEMQGRGYDISYASDAEIIHVHDETAREIYNRYRRESYAHQQIVDRSFSFVDFVRLSASNIKSDYAAALDEDVFWENLFEVPQFRLIQFWGTYRGFNQEGPISEGLWQRFYYPERDSYPSKNSDDDRDGSNSLDESDANKIEYPDQADLAEFGESTP